MKIAKLPAIYLIKNKINGMCYIGSAVNLFRRFQNHKATLRNNWHSNRYLQNSWNKYGESAFEFKVLEYLNDPTLVIKREQAWLNWFDCIAPNRGYNISPTAGNTFGTKFTEEIRLKMSKSKKGPRKPHSEETKLRIAESLRGKKASDETRAKLRNKKPQFYSEERRLRVAYANRDFKKWPCPTGKYCKCGECISKKRAYNRTWNRSKKLNENGAFYGG